MTEFSLLKLPIFSATMIQITLCNIPSPTSLQSSNTGCSQLQDKKFQLIMVVYNLKHNHFLPPQLFIPFYIFMIISFFFSQLTKFSSAISFNYTYFSASNPNISYELSAYAECQVIKLTTDKQAVVDQATVGRATYFKPSIYGTRHLETSQISLPILPLSSSR